MRLVSIAIYLALCSACSMSSANCEHEESLHFLQKSEQHTLSGPFSIGELEEQHLSEIQESGERLPFGYANEEWVALKAKMREGDEIYYVVYVEDGFGVANYVLVQGDCVVFSLIDWIT